ncbi:hypothetical protein [Salinirubrum litoreum]|uniref:Right handed beta helix region n=1 Tax=Salinirubrum litoreum TaxID=1126234 RepID=A0ABD5RCA6_9EURY|nr:hypothetical protein [Salinirubrum litoreum]
MDETPRRRTVSRRAALGAIVTTLGVAGTARGSGDWLRVTDYGVDNTGTEPVSDALDEIPVDDGDSLAFPPGRYLFDDWYRHTGFDDFELRGDDATVVPTADYPRNCLFKLGVPDDPGGRLFVEGFDFDYTAPDTGLRALQAHVDDRLRVWDVDVLGPHDSGRLGPFLFDVTDPDGDGEIRNVNAPDGGAFSVDTPGDIWVGPTGLIVSPYHVGDLVVRDCTLGAFPDNGLYVSSDTGRVVVRGGYYENSNVASIRLSGDGSAVLDATVVVDEARPLDEAQRAIRLDGDGYNRVANTTVYLDEPNDWGLSVQSAVDHARIEDCRIVVRGDEAARGVSIDRDAGRVDVLDTEIQFDAPGQAIYVAGPSGPDADQVWLLRTTVTGTGDGSVGRHAVRVERGNTTVDRLDVQQSGGASRRALKILGEECYVKWGEYETEHVPVVNDADGTRFEGITSRSTTGAPGLKLAAGTADTEVLESTLYGGYTGRGIDGSVFSGNRYPEA